MDWLGTLSPLVAVVVLFVWALRHDKRSTIDTIQTVSKCFVDPLQKGIQESLGSLETTLKNHLEHDFEMRLAELSERQEMRKAIEEMTRQLRIANGEPES